ncbi:MAG: hypothetical protein AB7T49_19215 [Oligoflexales bacterium]
MLYRIMFCAFMVATVSCKQRENSSASDAFAAAPGTGYSMSCVAGDFPEGQQFYLRENAEKFDVTMAGQIRDEFVPLDFLQQFYTDARSHMDETNKIEFSMPKNQCKFSQEDPSLFFCSSGVDFPISLNGIKFDNEMVHVSGEKISETNYKGVRDYMKIHFFFNLSRNGNTAVRYWPQFTALFEVDSPNSLKLPEDASGSHRCEVVK